jgi:photosystem II stability/assembly factor-like uncharacterized protein
MKNIYSFLVIVCCFAHIITYAQQITPYTFGSLRARELGPATSSGRVTALEALYLPSGDNPKEKRLCIYVGSAAGGVWKSKDNGTTFKAIFSKEKQQSIGCISIDPRYQDSVVWVGTGECNVRNSVSLGGGIYKTTDAGDSWKLMGLENVERIAKIALHPKNPDIALVAGMGALWSDSKDRGIYRTEDGGKTFQKVLYIDEKTGCADIVINPENPNICYASMWEFRRKAWNFSSGGKGSGLFKSTDAGKTWTKQSNSLPEGDLGRIILAIAPSKPSTMYAMIESKESGLYRSDDNGDNWKKMSNAVSVTARPFYFSCLYVDPYNENKVYRPSFQLGISNDGGKTFNGFSYGGGNHPDHHALWIDPENPQHLLLGTDGGVYRTFDRGVTWSQCRNLPLAQMYHISYDFEEPYNVFGGLQDNGSWMAPHRIQGGSAIQNKDWNPTGWGDGFAIVRDRADKDIIYFESQGGSAIRRHLHSGETKPISPFEELGEKKLRFNWNTPIVQSALNPKTLYIGSQYLHRSYNHGDTWERISPDLTTNDSSKYNPVESGGVTKDNTSAENHCTIYTINESPLDEKIIWVGTDDGNIQCTSNGGNTWQNVSKNLPKTIKPHTWVSSVEPSHFDKSTVYITLEDHTRGDFATYILKSTDFGLSWKQCKSDSLRGFAHVIREDLVNKNLLFAGTESGLFISIDAGESWAQFKNEIPSIPVRDIAIHPRDHDVIIGTHGRGAYIIDDITPLRGMSLNTLKEDFTFLPTRISEMSFATGFQEFSGSDEFAAANPNRGARFAYYLKSRHMIGDMSIEIFDKKTNAVLTTIPASKRKGVNLLSWNMDTKAPRVAISQNTGGGNFGYTVLPGEYGIRVKKNGKEYTSSITIVSDKKSVHSKEDRIAQNQTAIKCWGMVDDLAFVSEQITAARDTLSLRIKTIIDEKENAIVKQTIKTLDSLHSLIVAEKSTLFADSEDKIREKLAGIYGTINQYAGKPSAEQLKRIDNIAKDIQSIKLTLDTVFSNQITMCNSILSDMRKKPIKRLSREEFDTIQ